MRKKILSFLLLFMAILGFATWQYRLFSILLLLFDEKEKHYMLIHQKERIIDFLNHELELD